MDKELFDIEDNDIRVLGAAKPKEERKPETKRRLWPWLLLVVLLITIVVLCLWAINRSSAPSSTYSKEVIADTTENVTYKTTVESEAYVQASLDTINDIALQMYSPIGGHVELLVGQLPTDNNSIILAARAADYRADNGQIAGAFVYKGELISRGYPKLGFCAIIGDTLTMGKSQETSLFERAVEQGGYFFRQFSLVHDGKLGETLPKGKAIRRALCYYKDNIAIVETIDYESLHDFSQALMDMGVQEAISLVGSVALPLYVDKDGKRFTNELEHEENAQETYIVWRK